jgi:hypothetical protein
LEKIITERLSNFNAQTSGGQANANLVSFVQNLKSLQSSNIGNIPISGVFNGGTPSSAQQQSLALYLSTIQSLMLKLVNSMRIVHAAQGAYYWLPQPSNAGPEAGSTVRDVPLNVNVSQSLMTSNDFDIIANQAQVLLSSLSTNLTQPTATPDIGGFAFSNYKLTFDSTSSNSQGDVSSQTQETLTKKRTRLLNKAGDALQIVEMIMGEYSGLGLADIVAVIGAMYIMPATDLLGFLDDDAIVRAEQSLNQPTGSLQSIRPGIIQATTSLASTVNVLYQIMDQIFDDYANNGALTQQ